MGRTISCGTHSNVLPDSAGQNWFREFPFCSLQSSNKSSRKWLLLYCSHCQFLRDISEAVIEIDARLPINFRSLIECWISVRRHPTRSRHWGQLPFAVIGRTEFSRPVVDRVKEERGLGRLLCSDKHQGKTQATKNDSDFEMFFFRLMGLSVKQTVWHPIRSVEGSIGFFVLDVHFRFSAFHLILMRLDEAQMSIGFAL